MYTSQTGNDSKSFKAFFAVTMLVAAALVFFGLQIMMVGPLKDQLGTIQAKLQDNEKDMRKLVAERNQLWRTNDLLSGLKAQAKSVESIQQTLASINNLRDHVQHEAKQTQQALTAFNSIVTLHKQLAAQDAHTKLALEQLDGLLALRQSVIDTSSKTGKAIDALDNIGEIADAAIASASQIEDASQSITKLASLKNRVLGETDGLDAAQKSLDRIESLHTKLAEGEKIASAEENANRLLVINDSLASAKLEEAGTNLDGLMTLESKLAAKGEEVAKAVQTLEILDDFQSEVDSHIRSIEGIRRTMVEIAMLESSVGRASRVLQPLVELSSLRRLGETEVREAARMILDQRSTRLSQNSAIVKSARKVASDRQDDLVPLPPEAKEASASE